MLPIARSVVCTLCLGVVTVTLPPCAAAQTQPAPSPQAPVTELARDASRDGADPAANDAAPATHRSVFRDLFGDVGGDFRRLPSTQSAAWLGIGFGAAEASHLADRNATKALSTSSLTGAFHSGSLLGGGFEQMGGAFATYAIGRLTGHARVTDTGAELVRAQLITQGLTLGIKMSVRRDRPDGTPYSFPSGHTSTSFASATVLQREFGWKVGVPAYGLATYIAASRVQAKRHYLSDVAFGAALGVLVGRTVTIGHGDKRFALAPIAGPRTAGIGFTLVGSR